MTKARDIAVGTTVDTSSFLTATSNLDAAKLTTGTIPNARYGTPTFNGSNLTNLTSGNLTGALPAISGASLTGIAAGGKLLQIVSEKFSTDLNIGNSSFEEVFSKSITPSASTSKVLVLVSGGRWAMYGSPTYEAYYQVERETTEIMHGLQTIREIGNNIASGTLSVTYLDSPSSSSAVSYKLNARSTLSGRNVAVCNALSPITMTLIEIAA